MVVFVLPFFLEQTLRFVAGAARIPGGRLAIVSQDPIGKMPGELRARVAAHRRVDDVFDVAQLHAALAGLAREAGPVDCVMGTLEQLQVPLARVREELGLGGMSVEAARNFRDKSRMKDVLRAAGLPCARHALIATAADAEAFAAEVGYPLVVKPPAGAGAVGTNRLDDAAGLARYLARHRPDPANPSLAEDFITGDEYSFDSVWVRGEPVWHSISHYRPAPLVVMENPWIQWNVLLPREIDGPEYDDIRDVGHAANAALGLRTGLTHMEWFRKPDGRIAVSEVGARPPGAQITSLLSYAHDLDFYGAWPRLVAREEFSPPPRRYAAGAAYVRGRGRGRVKRIHGLGRAQRHYGDIVVEAKLPREGQPPASGYEGDGYIIVRHEETDVVAEALASIVEMIQVELG